jgi:menaquinone-dependent protoporphyrinogen oxidase
MRARRIGIVYGTRYGQTAKIALRIEELLAAAGEIVTVTPADDLPLDFSPRDYDGVIVGASVIAGKHQRSVRDFVRRYRPMLNEMPTAFLSVSASAASADEGGRAAARRMLDDFLRETGWRPVLVQPVGGAIAYTKYSFFVRWMLRRISAKTGGPTDTSRDHELTDWSQVERFATTFARLMPRVAEPWPATMV